MCGRFTLRTIPRDWAEVFAVVRQMEGDWGPAYNIAPTQQVLCIRDREERELFKAKWGLIPSWAKDAKIGSSCINARVETVDTKPAFRSAFKQRRCLVMADGFYEWRKSDKQPHYISLKSGEQMAFAGLWQAWKSPDGWIDSCTICTTDAHDMMGQLHDRMPVILPRITIDHWLDLKVSDADELKSMLRQFPGEEMQSWAVGRAVGNVRNQGPKLMEPIDTPETLNFH
jgi:putative SOS response-associated peptidase YedK